MINRGMTGKHADQSNDRVRRLVAMVFGAKPDDIDGKTMKRAEQDQARVEIARLVGKARIGGPRGRSGAIHSGNAS